MKKLFLLLALAATAVSAHAYIGGTPFLPEIDARFNALEQGNIPPTTFPMGAADGHYVKQIAKATYDFSKYTGAVGTYNLGVSLPANAIILHSFVYSITQPTTSASGTLALKCQNTGDILATTAAASFGAAGASIEGAATGTTYKYTTAACNLQAVIATGALTAGKVAVYVEYAVHQ
jgi:hypothetical protein